MNSNQGEGDKEKNPQHLQIDPAQEFTFTNESDESDDYISSYNYFVFYNSLKPVDPRLPKPTYKPEPNLDFRGEKKDN